MSSFEQPLFLLLIPLGLIAIWKLVRQKSRIGFSSSALLEGAGMRLPLLWIERLLMAVFVAAVGLILARPTEQTKNAVAVYQEARDIVLVLDISGSMQGESLGAAREVLGEFVAGRPQDRLALFSFYDLAFMEWPLSPDHEVLIYRLNDIFTTGGTKIATGVIAGLEHLKRYGQNAGAMIVVSDGSSEVSDEERAAIEAALGSTKFYWIWIGSQTDALAQIFGEYVEGLGGKVFRGGIEDLADIFAEISVLEASPVIWEQQISVIYHFGVLPLVALLGLLLAGLVHLFREV